MARHKPSHCVVYQRPMATAELIVRVPDRGVVFTGDLFLNRAPPVLADTDILAWRRVIDMLSQYGRETQYVPGHGPIGRR